MSASTPGSRGSSRGSSRRPPVLPPAQTPGSTTSPPSQQVSSSPTSGNPNSHLVKKPFICRESWSPSLQETQAGCISIEFGEQGYVHAAKGNNWLHIVIPIRKSEGLPKYDGLVPASRKYLEIGTVEYGNVTVDAHMNLPLNINVRPEQAAANGLFASTIKALCVAFYQAGDSISLPPNYRNRLSNPNDLPNLAVQAAQAAGVLGVLDMANFHISQLQGALTGIGQHDTSGGVYIQILDFRTQRGIELRIGSTHFLGQRSWQHERDKKADVGRFYSAWRSMGSQGRYTMSFLLRDVKDSDDRFLLEQFLILMFGCYRKYLLQRKNQSTLSTDATNDILSADASGLFQDHNDSVTARKLSDVAEQAFRTSGWVPLTKRSASGCSIGWNHSSPIFETAFYEPLIWTRLDVPGVKAVFRRTAIRQSTGRERFDLFGAKRTIQIAWGTNMPEVGTLIYPVVESMLNGKPHPFAWADIIPETLALWSDWGLALGVAIRLEWSDPKTGKWMSRFVQIAPTRSHPNMKLDNERLESSVMGYAQAMGVRRKMLRQTCPSSEDDWLKEFDLGLAVVKQVYFNNLEQRIELYDVASASEGAAAVRIPKEHLELKLKNLGATNIYNWPMPVLIALNTGRLCDYCTVTKGYQPTTTTCRRAKKTDPSCQVCESAGIPCSWTTSRSAQLTQALSVRTVHQQSIQAFEIEDPNIQERSAR